MIALYLLTAFQIADVISTYIALKKGASEGNPIMAAIMNVFGNVGGMLIVKGAIIALVWLTILPEAFLWAACVFYTWVIYNNIKVIKQQ